MTGCSVQNPFSDRTTPATDALPDLAPDVATAVRAVGLLLVAQARATATATAFPGLRERVDPLVALHRAHAAALQAAVPDGVDARPTATPDVVPTSRTTALARLTKGERDLHDGLTGLALRAESGPFARLLGSMAAATSQQIVVLTR
ncbi:MAG: hypothetical protein JWQ74_3448 [Marmoricola sp.]|nr:hypothetical protein [Marmoricola sp.]